MRRPVLGSLALALLSLVALRVPDYDPTAWLIWGRELTEGTLSMVGGPSWKPLPVALTTLFSLFGDDVAPLLWLVVARASGFFAVYLTFRLACRLGGRTAGWIAAAGLGLATDFLYNCLRGDSEGLLVMLSFGAIELHFGGRRRLALVVGLLAALLRPEVWPLIAIYGLWLLREERSPATAALVLGGGLGLLAAWFLPDYLSTGDFLRGAARAQHPVPGSPGQSAFPFGLTFVYAAAFLTWPLYAGAVYAVRRGDRRVVGLGIAATVLMVLVALLAQAGFTGNIRYVTLPGALVCVLGGVGLPGLAGAIRPRWARGALGAAAGIAVAVSFVIVLWGGVRLAEEDHRLGTQLDEVLAAAGGEDAVRACGRVSTTAFERQTLAYRLELPSREVYTHGTGRGTYFIREGARPKGTLLPVRDTRDGWTVRSSCPAP